MSRKQVARYIAQAWTEKSVPRKKLIKQMAAYLLESKTPHATVQLVNDIKKEIQASYGIIVANTTSARPLDAATRKEVDKVIKEITGGKRVVLDESIDASLLGGVKARTPEMEFDVSVRGKLNALKVR